LALNYWLFGVAGMISSVFVIGVADWGYSTAGHRGRRLQSDSCFKMEPK
jgi:hypothetical protein